MGFENGNLSFRIFWYKDKLSEAVIDNFVSMMAPDISTLSTSPINGWMGWKHLLDRDLSIESCYFQPWFHLSLNQAEKKIPKPLLTAYCRLEEEAERKARGLEFLPRAIKADVRQRVIDSLTPEMPPTLTGIPTVVNLSTRYVYAGAMKPSAMEVFLKHFNETTGTNLVYVDASAAALILKQINPKDYRPAVFTDDEAVDLPEEAPFGLEFLTWLWFNWEVKGGTFLSQIGEPCSYMLEGPVTFYNEGKGAHNVVLSNGLPLQGREAGAALRCGKKVSKVKFNLADSEKAWSASIDAGLSIRSLKLPKDKAGPQLTFQERMELIDKFVNTLLHIYTIFLDVRRDDDAWEKTELEMREWVRKRSELEDGEIGGRDV